MTTPSGKRTDSKTSALVVHVPVSAGLSADDEKKRLTYLNKIIMASLWSHQSAAFLREATVVKPTEFTVDLVTIQTKFNKDKYSSSSEAFTDFKKLFNQSQMSMTADIKNAGKLLLDQYNAKMRAYESRFNGEEQDCDAESDDVSMEEVREEIGQTCPLCTFLNDPTATGCQICEAVLPSAKGAVTETTSDSDRSETIRKVPSYWNCPECTFTNIGQDKTCQICETPRNIIEAGLPRAKGAVAETISDADRPEIPQKAPSDWNCPECTFTNSGQDKTCQVCETPRNIIDTLKKELDKCHNVISEIKKEKETNEDTLKKELDKCHNAISEIKKEKRVNEVSLLPYPSNWSGTLKQDTGVLRMVELTNTDPNYQIVERWIGNSFQEKGYELKSVRRVENWEMYQVYAQKYIAMGKRNGQSFENEKWLFHGTSDSCIDNICSYGFNRSYAGKNGTAYGVGTYFSPHVSLSAGYSLKSKSSVNKMLFCRVLTGHYTTGSSALIEPPMRSKTERFDSVVDKIEAPGIFVVFSDYQAYPEFEITFGYKSL